MTTPHLAKRRRLNDSVHKPFRSPLKVDPLATRDSVQHSSPLISRNQQPDLCAGDQPLPHSDKGAEATGKRSKNDAAQDQELLRPRDEIPDSEESDGASPLATSPTLAAPPDPTPASLAAPSTTQDECAAIQPAHEAEDAIPTVAEQQRQIRQIQQQIDVLSAAVPSKGSTARLPHLIQLWTRVAREAAETIYPSVKQRVEALGNHGAGTEGLCLNGRRRQQQQEDEADSVDAMLAEKEARLEQGIGYYGEELGKVERRAGLDEVRDAREALRTARTAGDEHDDAAAATREEDEEEEQGFTMGKMLHGMSIDWELLGWDEMRQDWKSD